MDCDERHEYDARGTKISETGKIVLPVRIDDNRAGQIFRRLMMIEHDWVEDEPCRLGKRRMARRPAIHRDQKLRARACEALDRFGIRAVAFENTVGNMDHARRPGCLEKIMKQCRGGGAIDIIVAKYRDRFASLDCPGNSLRRRFHVHQAIRVGEKILQLWVEIVLRIVWRHATPGENAGQEIACSMNLRDGKRKHLAPFI